MTIEEVVEVREAEGGEPHPSCHEPLRRPRSGPATNEASLETPAEAEKEPEDRSHDGEEARQAATPKEEKLSRQETAQSAKEEEAVGEAASTTIQQRMEALQRELDAASVQFTNARARLEAVHASITEFAVQGKEEDSLARSSPAWGRAEYQAASLRGLVIYAQEAQERQARRKQAEGERQRQLKMARQKRKAALRKVAKMEEARKLRDRCVPRSIVAGHIAHSRARYSILPKCLLTC